MVTAARIVWPEGRMGMTKVTGIFVTANAPTNCSTTEWRHAVAQLVEAPRYNPDSRCQWNVSLT